MIIFSYATAWLLHSFVCCGSTRLCMSEDHTNSCQWEEKSADIIKWQLFTVTLIMLIVSHADTGKKSPSSCWLSLCVCVASIYWGNPCSSGGYEVKSSDPSRLGNTNGKKKKQCNFNTCRIKLQRWYEGMIMAQSAELQSLCLYWWCYQNMVTWCSLLNLIDWHLQAYSVKDEMKLTDLTRS